MLCSKCFEEIISGQEVQVEGSIACKGCVQDGKLVKREIVTICHRKNEPIYNDEPIYEVYKSWGIEKILIINRSEKTIHCSNCHKEWLKEKEKEKKLWKAKKWWPMGSLFSTIISAFILICYSEKKVLSAIMGIVFLSSLFFLNYFLNQINNEIDKYKEVAKKKRIKDTVKTISN